MKARSGFTLVELLITVALTGLIFTSVGTAIFQLSTVSSYGNDKLTALHDIQNATNQINLDCQTAAAVDATGVNILTLTLPSAATITYSLSGTNLQRTAGTSVVTLSQNVAGFSSSVSGRAVSLSLDVFVAGRNSIDEPITYKVNLRPSTQ